LPKKIFSERKPNWLKRLRRNSARRDPSIKPHSLTWRNRRAKTKRERKDSSNTTLP